MAGEEDDKEVFFSTLSTFQDQGTMVDVIVEVENEQFPSHRLILSVYSHYFRVMFCSQMREEREELVRLSVLSADQFRLAHDYMYGRLWERIGSLDLQTALQVAEAANYLDMRSLLNTCCQVVIKEISKETLQNHEPEVYEMCRRFNMSDVVDHIDGLYLSFVSISRAIHESSVTLPSSRLIKYLSSNKLRIRSEMDVIELIRRWYQMKHEVDEGTETLQRLLSKIRVGLLHSEENIDAYIALCESLQVPVSLISPWPDAFQLRKALVNQPFWRLLFDTESKCLSNACLPRATLEVCCQVTFQDFTFTLRFCHISGPKGVDYTESVHKDGIHPRLCISRRQFTSMKLHRTGSSQWHCCSREGFFFIYVEQAMEPASQAPGVVCVFDSAREVFHCFDGVTPLLSMMSMASVGEFLYILGGRTSEGTYTFRSVDSIFAFNFRKFGWTRLQQTTLPQPAHSQAAVTMDGSVYLSGGLCLGYTEEYARTHGFTVARPLACLWRLPTDASSVSLLAPMRQARYQHRLLACRGFLYAVGGVCEALVSKNQQGGIERYDPRVDQWTTLEAVRMDGSIPPSVRFFGPVVALQTDGCIYVMGRGTNPPSAGIWQFNPELCRWQSIQLFTWENQQMLTATIPWSCLNNHSENSEVNSSRRRNHDLSDRHKQHSRTSDDDRTNFRVAQDGLSDSRGFFSHPKVE